ncbi:APC family permease [Edwardsiella ictaluri]|nr:APC family permease [Edwardsiella ictaluri]KMQ79402.1 amino acid transporter [Edwardsiella ictaluri]KOO56040.1 amino acid transporter [Edwardsiella ictaluri]QPW31642.1 APC family permease [Edwardsiella ictaluri]WJH22631.1 APC family permease [Edwardsiella ictaluri]
MSTKELKRVLGRSDLMGIAVGQIIGAGIMSLTGIAIAMTGRSANFAFLISTLFVIAAAIPLVFVNSCLRLRGGFYTQTGIFIGAKWSGLYIIQYTIGCISISLFTLSLAQYLHPFIPYFSEKTLAIAVLTLFFIINYFGVATAARVQRIMVLSLVGALLLFTLFGLPAIRPGFFSPPDFLTHGTVGLLQTAALLVFATGGAEVIVDVSGEARNPKRDIPLVIIISTLAVALLYALLCSVAAGVLPLTQVAGQSLLLVAEAILPRPLFIYFVICGAIFALATTLNAKISTCTKPILQAGDDGWFPRQLAYLHPQYKTPVYLLVILYLIGLLPILFDFSMGAIASSVVLLAYSFKIVLAYKVLDLPRLFPQQYARSPYRVSPRVLKCLLAFSMAGTAFQCYLLASRASAIQLCGLLTVTVLGFLYVSWRYPRIANSIEESHESE